MKYRRYTEQEVIEKTRETIHLFIKKQIGSFVTMLDENFVWVGDYEPIYMRGIPAFLESVREEARELPVEITEEEYALLSHEWHLWITYGRFTAKASGQSAKIHFTFVWKQTKDDLLLLHANANHAKPMVQATAQSKIFEALPEEKAPMWGKDTRRLTLRDLGGSIHYLLAKEIQYIRANNKVCEIFIKGGSFSSRITLKELANPPFIQIHKSYLINLAYLREVCRYRATLLNGTELPVGKAWYMELKKRLKVDGSASYCIPVMTGMKKSIYL